MTDRIDEIRSNTPENIITLENFSENNRSKIIGNSLYRICRNEERKWYVFEIYNTGDGNIRIGHNCEFEELNAVIDYFNCIDDEKRYTSIYD